MRKKLVAAILLVVCLTAGCGREHEDLEKACVGIIETNVLRKKAVC